MLSNDKVLVVDNSSTARSAINNILRDHLFCKEIVDASDGQDALRKIRQNNIDWIFSDWDMPNMTGIEFLKEVRSDPRMSHTPFIMVTARSDRDSLVTAVQEGVTSFIIKPFTAKKLVEKVYLAKGKMERRNAERTKIGQEQFIKLELNSPSKGVDATLIDISLTGFLCLVEKEVVDQVSIFDLFDTGLTLPKTTHSLSIPCQVIRLEADPHHPARSSHVRLAARFQPMQEAQRQHLVGYIEEVAKVK